MDDDSQQGPEHSDARPRADSSAVARFNVADLERASLRENVVREREKLHTTRISSRRNGARSARSTRLGKEVRKAPPDRGKARRH